MMISTPFTITVGAAGDFPAGVHGPTTIQIGQAVQYSWPIGTYFARGLAGPATFSLSGADAAHFSLALNTAANGSCGVTLLCGDAPGQAQPSYAISVNATDGITVLSLPVAILNGSISTPIVTVSGNTVTDAPNQPVNYWGIVTVTALSGWGGATSWTITDPSGLLVPQNGGTVLTITQANALANAGKRFNITVTPNVGAPMTVPIFILHEAPPTIAFVPNGVLSSATPPTDGYGSNRIGTLVASSDSGVAMFSVTNNPTGALEVYSYDPWYGRTGFVYLSQPVATGTLTGTCVVTSSNGVSGTFNFNLPVAAGTTYPSASLGGVVTAGLTNFLPTANMLAPVGSPTVVLNLTVAGFAPNWALSQLTVIDDNCQQTNGQVFPAAIYQPRYAIQGSGQTGTVAAWNLSAINEINPQIDHLVVTLTDGAGNYCSGEFDISTAWHPYTGAPLTVGTGGTWPDLNTAGVAIWAAPATYAGAAITVLPGCPVPAPFHGPSFTTAGWWPCPLIFEAADGTHVLFDVPTGWAGDNQGKGGWHKAGGYDLILRRIAIGHVTNGSNAGAFYVENQQPGNFTLEDCYAFKSDMGCMNGDLGNRLWITDCLFVGNGNGAGTSHNVYCDAAAALTISGTHSIDSMSHAFKSRALRTTITNSYAIEGMNCFNASMPVDFCDGGEVTLSGLYVRKQADGTRANNGGTIDWCSEIYAGASGFAHPAWAVNSLTTTNVTIDSMRDVTLGGSNQPATGFRKFFYDNDPVRNLPITENIASTAFFGLSSAVWAVGTGGGSPTPTSKNGSIADPPTLGSGNVIAPSPGANFPSSALLTLLDPLTSLPPIVIPSGASMVVNSGNGPNIGSIPGIYDLALTVPSGAPSGTPVTAGLLAAYPWTETEMSPVTWTLVEGGAEFSIAPVGVAHVQLSTAAALGDGIHWLGVQAVGSVTVRKSFAVIVGPFGQTVVPPPPPPPPPSQFLPHVKFAGDAGNGGLLINQARHDLKSTDASPTVPFFMAGHYRSEDFPTFGMLCSFGNQGDRGQGLIALSTQGTAVIAFEWFGLSWAPFAATGLTVGQWTHGCFVFKGPVTSDLIIDGVHAPPVAGVPAPVNPPMPVPSTTALAVTFGSYYNLDPTKQNADCHCFNGSLRDWAIVNGVPTDAEIARHMNGESAVSVWGSRVWGAWAFTSDPSKGPEPDTTGNGHDLTYIDAGIQAGHSLPVLITS